MATKTYNETVGYTFQWNIENTSHCWVENDKFIDSPTFTAEALEGTKWVLRLYISNTIQNRIGFYLRRKEDCVGPNTIYVNFQLSFLNKDGSILKEGTEVQHSYIKSNTYGFAAFEEREKVFVTEREAFLPKDTLTVQCTIWKTKEKPVKPKQLYARTIFEVKQRNFIWRIDEFSTLKSGLKYKFKDSLIEYDLVLNEGLDFEKKLGINIASYNENIKYFSFKVSIVDSRGKKENCGNQEYFANDLKRGVLCTLLFTKMLMANKIRYLPNDILSLYCECVYSTGTVLYEHCGYGVIAPERTHLALEGRNELNIVTEKSEIIPFIVNDLKFMYNDQIFSDMELRTSTQTFPSHKNILSARSPVFRKMFSSDMKEKNNGQVDISDLENDTIHRMLLYIYTDTLENMPLEDACKLYEAADKYQILSLRSSCSLFLKDNLCSDKACEVLVLADRHQDDDLKSAVQDFILRHDKDVFGSLEWKDFIDTHSKLAADVMYRFTLRKII